MNDKSLDSFRASLRAASRGIWDSSLDPLNGADAIYSAIRRGFEQAWAEGSRSCGILPGERTEEEIKQLNQMIGDNFQHVAGLVQWIYEHSKANGYKFEIIQTRLKLWVNRYEEVKNVAISFSCKNLKYRWQIDGGEHCRTCLKLNGRVARASVWAAHGIAPRMITDRLRCHGYNCKCFWVETDAPATRGRFPGLP